jgi:hypothetical protein
MEARMCFEFSHGLADISKFYPSPLARDEILISSNSCQNSKHILVSMIYFLNNIKILLLTHNDHVLHIKCNFRYDGTFSDLARDYNDKWHCTKWHGPIGDIWTWRNWFTSHAYRYVNYQSLMFVLLHVENAI